MFRPAARAAIRTATSYSSAARRLPARRWASTAADRPRSWKGSALRWGLAGAVVYYYNTSNVFAEETHDQYAHHPPPASSDTEALPTLDSYAKKTKPRIESTPAPTISTSIATEADASPVPPGGPEDLEAEASQQGAFNEETGEINWDCPCLGGMAHGPCGEEFRAAFSCFVYSKEDPKGVDCIDKFKGMQDCFRAHPDIYGAELEDDEEEGAPGVAGEGAQALARDATEDVPESLGARPAPAGLDHSATKEGKALSASKDKATSLEIEAKEKSLSESDALVPKAAHDTTDANAETKSKA